MNCEDVFEELRPHITEVIVTRHFHRDLPEFDTSLVVDGQHVHFRHLHKLEEHFDGVFVFRALKDKTHIVYAVDGKRRLIFLRAFHNFHEYGNFLADRKGILSMIGSV
ncbi:MAG: hypothetical protein JW778_06105 [Candidatus Altiarchaeota archaeon]|nr:hypothetical protein [Candidatus Altiarchaeota archaeon]